MVDNDFIIRYICKKFNINLDNFIPMNRYNEYSDEDFDKHYSLDRTYENIFNNFKTRIRFVKHNKKEITLFKDILKISHIFEINGAHNTKEDKVYSRYLTYRIPLEEIERSIKLNRIREKL